MGTWIGTARSNYFLVKDADAFRVWADEVGLFVSDRLDHQRTRRYAVLADEGAGWPSVVPTSDRNGWRDFDLVTELAAHVVPGEIVVCVEAGAEKLRYITGEAVAFRVAFGGVEKLRLTLKDIYDLAEQQWGTRPNEAEY